MPRHPPCALTHLTTTRCSHPLCNTQHTTTPQHHRSHHTENPCVRPSSPGAAPRTHPTTHGCPLRTQQRAKPTKSLSGTEAAEVFHPATPTTHPQPGMHRVIRCGNSERRDTPQPTATQTTATITQDMYQPHPTVRLLRKEVIQPHLPVRLPCYDFTPIADPTFDGSLPKGLGHRLRVLPTFVV